MIHETGGGREISHMLPASTHAVFPITNIPITALHSLHLTNLQIHHNHPKTLIYITALFFLQFYLDAAPSMGLDKCTMTCIIPLWYYAEYFHCPRNLWRQTYLLLPHLLPPILGNHWSFYCLKSFAFSRMPYSENHTVCSLFRVVSFTQ